MSADEAGCLVEVRNSRRNRSPTLSPDGTSAQSAGTSAGAGASRTVGTTPRGREMSTR
ncbi:MAG: hypothetical protein OXG67_12575 [bacterium]|nr:hypothetical protein [bacterium]